MMIKRISPPMPIYMVSSYCCGSEPIGATWGSEFRAFTT